jgi:hypothetical protein
MLSFSKNVSTAILGFYCYLPKRLNFCRYLEKLMYKNIISNEIRAACSSVMVTACALNVFTERNVEFLYRE